MYQPLQDALNRLEDQLKIDDARERRLQVFLKNLKAELANDYVSESTRNEIDLFIYKPPVG
tara:strand:- start:3421 stop:3603 length:183 start_codon:yes stop_codon:yes gene_type:complete